MPVLGLTAGKLTSTPGVREWTVMVYVGADSDYYDNSERQISDFTLKQLRKSFVEPFGSEKGLAIDVSKTDVNLVVMMDTLNSTGVYIHDHNSLSKSSDRKDFDYLPGPATIMSEMDTSDPGTLSWFVNYAKKNYPSEKTLLIVKNGHAWCGVCPDFSNLKGVPWDLIQDEEVPMMPIEHLADELGALTKRDGSSAIDVLVLDGSNMASLEVAYELRNSVDYFVASQQEVPIDGFPYYLIMSRLMGEASETLSDVTVDDIGPRELAAAICNDYAYYYNQTGGKKNLLPHLLNDGNEANIACSAFEMVNDHGENNMELIADAFFKIIRYMMTGEGATEAGPKDLTDSFDGSDLWDWIPVHRNAIASSRDFALIGKLSEQQGYEWLPDVESWVTYLQAYLWEFAEDWGWERDEDLRAMGMEFKEIFNKSRVGLDRCLILDRYWDCGCNPEGLNMWFPPNWQHWDDIMDVNRTREYGYDGYGSLIDLPREYYCIDCPTNYSAMGFDLLSDHKGYDIPETEFGELWIQFYDIYYDARWLLYSMDGAACPPAP